MAKDKAEDKANVAARGIAGEIVVSGCQVAAGYLNLTSFVSEHGVPSYATGDIGRWTAAGNVEFLGRKDRQAHVGSGQPEHPPSLLSRRPLPTEGTEGSDHLGRAPGQRQGAAQSAADLRNGSAWRPRPRGSEAGGSAAGFSRVLPIDCSSSSRRVALR